MVGVVLAVVVADGGGGGEAVAETGAECVAEWGEDSLASTCDGNQGVTGSRRNRGKSGDDQGNRESEDREVAGWNILRRHCDTLRNPENDEYPSTPPRTRPILTSFPFELKMAVVAPAVAPMASTKGMVLSTVHDPSGTGWLAGMKSGGPSTRTSEQPEVRSSASP